MRVYIPATLAMLQQLVADGSMFPVSGTAFAVTPTLSEAYAEGDDDELAEVAQGEAALASLRAHGPALTYAAPEAGHVPDPDPRALPDWLTSAIPGPAAPCTD